MPGPLLLVSLLPLGADDLSRVIRMCILLLSLSRCLMRKGVPAFFALWRSDSWGVLRLHREFTKILLLPPCSFQRNSSLFLLFASFFVRTCLVVGAINIGITAVKTKTQAPKGLGSIASSGVTRKGKDSTDPVARASLTAKIRAG